MAKTWIYKDNVDTDVIIPARYLNTTDEKELASHCMEDIDKDFAKNVQTGDVIVAGENFGCGSSREHAPIAIKASGIKAVIAKSFARIFFRNSINIGLVILENSEIQDEISPNDELNVDVQKGLIKNLNTGKEYKTTAYTGSIRELTECRGLINYTKSKLGMK